MARNNPRSVDVRGTEVDGLPVRITFGVLLLGWGAGVWAGARSATAADSPAPHVVLVELFTSQGCSSCPPADALLRELHAAATVEGVRVIALSEHVDYWNGLGWADPYSSEVFSDRQRRYARSFGSDRVYTPQLVVDGREEMVGSHGGRVRAAIARAAATPKAWVDVGYEIEDAGIRVRVGVDGVDEVKRGDGNEAVEVWVAITEDALDSRVPRGENAGRELRHDCVVRGLLKLGDIVDAPAEFTRRMRLEPEWARARLRLVGFLQEASGSRILGVAAVSLGE